MVDLRLLIECKELTLAKDLKEIETLKEQLFNMSEVRKLCEFFLYVLPVTQLCYFLVFPIFRNNPTAATTTDLNAKFVAKHTVLCNIFTRFLLTISKFF